MRKISVYKLNRLRNHDFTRAYKLIVSQLEGEDFLVEDVQTAYENICAHNAKLATIKNGEAKHELTETMANLRDMRHQYILSLRGRIVYSRKSPFAEERDAANKLYRWLEKEQEFLRSCSIDTQAKSIDNMQSTLQVSQDLQAALTTLGLSDAFTSIVTATSDIDAAYKERTAEQSALTKQTNLLRNDAYNAMQVFIVALEQTLALKKGDVERSRFNLNEIKRVVTKFTSRYDSDATRKKNAEEAAKAEAEAKAKAEKEANQEGQPKDGEMRSGNVVTMGRKLATTGTSGASGTKLLDDMDLQMGDAMSNVALKNPGAMNERVTSGVPLGGDENKVADAMAGTGGASDMGSDTLGNTPTDNETTQLHNGATMKDDDDVDHES